jgi:hypothetical protein
VPSTQRPAEQLKLRHSPDPRHASPAWSGEAEAQMPWWQMLSAQSVLLAHGSFTLRRPLALQPLSVAATSRARTRVDCMRDPLGFQ